MSDINLKKYQLCQLFKNQRGNSTYTKSYCNAHVGDYEVYTGTTIGTFGKIDTFDYETPNLTYTTDGVNAGELELLEGKYNIGGHRGLLIPICDNIYLKYFEFILKPLFKAIIKDGNVPSVTWAIIKHLEVPVPVTENGCLDLESQRKIAEKFSVIKEKSQKLSDYKIQLQDTYVNIKIESYIYKDKPLSELFEYRRGRSCTISFCNKHKGDYPVWSANNNNPVAYVNFFDYDGEYISFCRNGIAGKITILSGKYTINEHRFLLIPKNSNIDIEYIRYVLEPILRQNKKGRSGHDGQNEFTQISFRILDTVMIPMPILENGEYDVEAQKTIAQKYGILERVKKGICDKIEELTSAKILLIK